MRMKESIVYCSRCYNITDIDPCQICSNPAREQETVCVVEEPLDVLALEKTGVYKGLYHVLHGALSPLNGIGRRDLRIDELLRRLEHEPIREVLIATNPGVEGDMTAAFIKKAIREELKRNDVRITVLARGLPMGGELEYADEGTLGRAIEGRREF